MRKITMSRRGALETGAGMMIAAASVPSYAAAAADANADAGLSQGVEQAVRKYYTSWEKKDWHPFDLLLADNFTFTSANDDDHISKSTFKTRCWDTQIDHIAHFDLLHVHGSGNEAMVMYICSTKNGKKFRNVEYHRVRDGRIEAIECYFGAQASFASAVSTGKS